MPSDSSARRSPAAKQPKRFRWRRLFIVAFAALFVLLNIMAYFQARGMCRYERPTAVTTRITKATGWDKAKLLFTGPTVRRQLNTRTPADFGMQYQVRRFPGAHGIELEAWEISGRSDLPTLFLFPGYGASKDTLLRSASEFHQLGFCLWLVDFHGIGGSNGDTTTVGYDEADDVVAAVRESGKKNIMLYGTSMGAVAVLRAVHSGAVKPSRIILEAPYDRFCTTLGHRFELMQLPTFPFAHLLTFWSGAVNGFNGFDHNPIAYARSIQCPTLLMQGEHDDLVGKTVPSQFAQVLGTKCTVRIVPGARHAFLLQAQPDFWRSAVYQFLKQ